MSTILDWERSEIVSGSRFTVFVFALALVVGLIGVVFYVLGINAAGGPNLAEAYLGLGIIFADIIVAGFFVTIFVRSK